MTRFRWSGPDSSGVPVAVPYPSAKRKESEMLCLSCAKEEEILIGGGIRIKVLDLYKWSRSKGRRRVRLGITAPDHIKIIRTNAVKQEKDGE
jgi:sRNA-binding carbon storage regulator CsrA